MPTNPLVVTLHCSGAGWQTCQALRKAHFPAFRNIVPAHIALFHHLPGDELAIVEQDARDVCQKVKPFPLQISGLRSLGGGVALKVESVALLEVHRQLADSWVAWLTPQDRARFNPHVTVQNKVQPAEARRLLEQLQAEFSAFVVDATGLEFWHYRGGPWEPAAFVPFSAA